MLLPPKSRVSFKGVIQSVYIPLCFSLVGISQNHHRSPKRWSRVDLDLRISCPSFWIASYIAKTRHHRDHHQETYEAHPDLLIIIIPSSSSDPRTSCARAVSLSLEFCSSWLRSISRPASTVPSVAGEVYFVA